MVADARSALSERSYKLILTDVFLPDGSGFELLRSREEAAPTRRSS